MKIHFHDWKYNQAKEFDFGGPSFWQVERFCPECRQLETLDLKETNSITDLVGPVK